MADQKKKARVVGEIKTLQSEPLRVQAENFLHLYINNVDIRFSAWDIGITLGAIIGEKENRLLVEERARVVMSLQHAKAFALALSQAIESFEDQVGEITMFRPRDKTEGSPPKDVSP